MIAEKKEAKEGGGWWGGRVCIKCEMETVSVASKSTHNNNRHHSVYLNCLMGCELCNSQDVLK